MLLRFHGSMTSRSCFSKAWAKQPLGGQCSPSRGPAPSLEQWGTWRPAAGCPPSQEGLSSHSAVFLAPCPVLFLLHPLLCSPEHQTPSPQGTGTVDSSRPNQSFCLPSARCPSLPRDQVGAQARPGHITLPACIQSCVFFPQISLHSPRAPALAPS